MTKKDEINSLGLANGWHAQQLRTLAKRLNKPMAEVFRSQIAHLSAYNVPAECVKTTQSLHYYRFLDGSEDKYPARSN